MVVVEAVVGFLVKKLGDVVIQEAIFLHGVGDQVRWMEGEFRRMQCFLKDADAKQEGDERVKNWVRDVRDVAYDAEDAIDIFSFEIAPLKRRGGRRGFIGTLKRYTSIFSELIAAHKLGSKIDGVKLSLRAISESRLTFGIENIISRGEGSSAINQSLQEWRIPSPHIVEPDFVGFEKDVDTLVARLTEGEPRRCVVSIVGMGGLGKTTLAKKVYNNGEVIRHFDSCTWLSISQQYSARELLQDTIRKWMVLPEEELKKLENMKVDELRGKLYQYLEGRRYLMVVDDIWKNEAWDALKDALPDTSNGSRILLTTRNTDVALHADAQSLPYELRFLKTDESWELFGKKAFLLGTPAHRPAQTIADLEKIGREVVEKCHGLPLAIVVIGGLLSRRKEPREWENVLKSISWQLVQGEVQISPILSLSYKDLPYHLKPCFLYLGNFPEDYVFRSKKLIQLWAAEGFLQQRGNETVEEVGEDCQRELIQRSLIQVVERSSTGALKSCRIHDLLRDLSISEAKEDKFLEVHHDRNEVAATPSAYRARRLAMNVPSSSLSHEYAPCNQSSNSNLRSLLIYAQDYGGPCLSRRETKLLCGGFKLLRVLDLNGVGLKELPSEIGELIHLRYLGCIDPELESLPSSIEHLHNLQTIYVSSDKVIKIPSTIGRMQQLRHVQVKSKETYWGGWGEIEGHPRLGAISNLQTLSRVKPGQWMHDWLGKLTHLRKLGIHIDREADAYMELLHQSIVKLDSLQSLLVTSYIEHESPVSALVPLKHLLKLSKLHLDGYLEKLPEPSEFPENLTKLTMKTCRLELDPLKTLEKLKNLRVLRLLELSYMGNEMVCSAEGFPRLESLQLERLSLEWRVAEGSMPTLLHLQTRDCFRMKLILEGLRHFEKLEVWEIDQELKQRFQEGEGGDWHKLQHVPMVDMQ